MRCAVHLPEGKENSSTIILYSKEFTSNTLSILTSQPTRVVGALRARAFRLWLASGDTRPENRPSENLFSGIPADQKKS